MDAGVISTKSPSDIPDSKEEGNTMRKQLKTTD